MSGHGRIRQRQIMMIRVLLLQLQLLTRLMKLLKVGGPAVGQHLSSRHG